VCYCGGDIDDCLFDNTQEQNRCGHCPLDGDDDDDYIDESDSWSSEKE